jgi:hypothetical protein
MLYNLKKIAWCRSTSQLTSLSYGDLPHTKQAAARSIPQLDPKAHIVEAYFFCSLQKF